MRSIRTWIIPAALAVLVCGCTYDELRRDTANVETTMADLRYQGIMNNLAMMVHNPASLPNPVAVSTGTVQVSDVGTANANMTWNPHGLMTWFLGIGSASRQVTEQWALQPLHKPDKLQLMRCAFQIMLDAPATPCGDPNCGPDCYAQLHSFLADHDKTPDLHCAIPRGWFSVGRKCDVPKGACYQAHYCDTYVWVMPEGIDGLSRFTLTILRIALTDQAIPTVTVDRTYNKGDGTPIPANLSSTSIHSTEVPPIGNTPKPLSQTGEVPPAGGGVIVTPTGGH